MRGLDWPTAMGKEPSLSSKLDFPNVNHKNCFNMFEFLKQSYVGYFIFFSRNAPSEEENIISIKLKININLIFIFLYVLKHAHSWEVDGNRKFEKDETFSLLWCGSSDLCSQDISGRLECCK